jgi:hypothetical protein
MLEMRDRVPVRKAMDDAMIALYQNGERINPSQGYPMRLLVPGYEGNMNVKWLRRIKVVDGPIMAQNESVAYTILMESGKAWRFFYGDGAIAVIDLVQRRKIAEYAVPAHPEGFQFDHPTGRIFVNVPKAAAIVVIDGLGGKQAAIWPLRGAGGNFPMALDETGRRILVAFRAPPRLGAFSIADGQSVGNVDLCGDADDVFVDVKRRRAYVSCGQGYIDVFDIQNAEYRRLARIPTMPGARTAFFFAPSTDRLFLAARATPAEPAAIWVFHAEP